MPIGIGINSAINGTDMKGHIVSPYIAFKESTLMAYIQFFPYCLISVVLIGFSIFKSKNNKLKF